MNLLALDTSTLRASLAIQRDDGRSWFASTDAKTRHGRMLLPEIRALLAEAGVSVDVLDAIAVGIGPGSYTGLRVGVMAAKTLSYATGARLLPLDSLDFFARSAPATGGPMAVIVDAQRGDFHVANYVREETGSPLQRLGPARILSAGDLVSSWGTTIRVAGPGISSWKLEWPPRVEVVVSDQANPRELLTMANEAIADGRFSDPFRLEPGYFRESSAENLWQVRQAGNPASSSPPLPD